MDQLSEALRDAVADPPPARIDIDGLITGEQHRARRQRWLMATALTALLATGVVTVPTYLSGAPMHGGGGGARCPGVAASSTMLPGDPQGPEPTEPCEVALARLKEAIVTVVRRVLPATTLTFTTPGGRPVAPEPDNAYSAILELVDEQGTSVLYVRLSTAPLPGVSGAWQYWCRPAESGAPSGPVTGQCGVEELPDGSGLVALDFPVFPDGMGHKQVSLFRTDSTIVALSSQNFRHPEDAGYTAQPGGQPTASPPPPNPPGTMVPLRPAPLTVDQLVELARAPELTLFP